MGKEAKPRRRTKQASASRPPTTIHEVPDHLLRLVILRLDTHVSLLRAAAVCKRWRRIAAGPGVVGWIDDGFFGRHPGPHVLGHYHALDSPSLTCRSVFVPADPSSVNARRFALDFLPRARRPWELVDGRGSLLLLASRRRGGFFPDLVVCEPASRRSVRIRPVADMRYQRCLGASLHSIDSRVASLSDFKVVCVLFERSAGMSGGAGTATSCTFDHRAQKYRWRKNGWQTQSAETLDLFFDGGRRDADSLHFVGRASGTMFWLVEDAADEDGTVLAARDNGKLTCYVLPEHLHRSHHHMSTIRFVDNGVKEDGYRRRVRLVSLSGDELSVYVGHEYDTSHWYHERTLRLSQVTRGLRAHKPGFFGVTAKIVTAWKGYLTLTPAEETWMLSLDLKTMQVERVDNRNRFVGAVYPYELETSPVVEACVILCEREGSAPTWRGHGKCSHICICR